MAQPVKCQSFLFRVHGTAGAAAGPPRRDTLDPDAPRRRPQHVILDSKPWSYTNGLPGCHHYSNSDRGWTVAAGRHLRTGVSGHTRLSVFQITSATRLGSTNNCYRSRTLVRPRLYSSAGAGCRGAQRRRRLKLNLAGPVDVASQHKMIGNVQKVPRGRGAALSFLPFRIPSVVSKTRALGVAAGDGCCRKAASPRPPGRPSLHVI